MGQKVGRLIGLIILTVVVFKVVLQHSSAPSTAEGAANAQIVFEAGSAASQGQIEITRIVYVTATPQPQPTVTPTETATETAVIPDVEPLRVVERSPNENKTADVQPTFQLVFNKIVNQLPRQRIVTVEPEIPLVIYWEAPNVLLVRPAASLDVDTVYTFALAPEIEAVDGGRLRNSYHWTFQPEALLDSHEYETLIDGRGSIDLNFNYPLDPASVEWTISPETEGDLVWSDDFKRLTFVGYEVFPAGRVYSIELGPENGQGLRQPNGMPVPAANKIDIEIEALATGMEPTRGGSDISPIVTIRIPFNREVDKEQVEAGLIIEPEPLVAPIYGWEQNTLLAEVVLTPDELHSVRIEASNLIDWQGRILSQEAIVWSFRTATIKQFAGFGYGPRLQSLRLGSGPNDRPTVEYSFINRQQPVPVTFELYEMAFADWQASPVLEEHDISEQLPVVTWEEAAPPTKPELYFLSNQTLLPEGVAPGFYRLRMKAFGFPQDDLAIILTDLALAVRTKDDTLMAWVVDFGTLEPIAAEVTVFRGGEQLAAGTTDSDGLVSLAVEGLTADSGSPVTIVARAGEQFTMAAINYSWQSYGAYGGVEAPDYLLHLTLDRPYYEPGETAYLRAVLRDDDDGVLTVLPPGQTLTVTLNGWDYYYNEIPSETVYITTDEYGVAYGEIIIPAEYPTSSYYATVEYRGSSTTRSFEVAEAQDEAAPIVQVTTSPIVGQGELIEVLVEVMDSSGRPISDSTVNISYLQPVNSGGGCYWSSGSREWFADSDYAQTGKTDQNGVYAFSMTAEMGYNTHSPNSESSMSHAIAAVVANVTQNGNTGTGFSVFEIANATESLLWEPSSLVQAAGQPFVVHGTVRDLAGEPVVGRAVTLRLHEVGEYGITTYSDPGARVYQTQATTDAGGRIAVDLMVEKPGYYVLHLLGQDRLGHEMKAFRPLYVTGEGEAVGIPSLKLGVGSANNFVGQTAQLVILAEQPGPALLTISNREGIRTEVVTLTGAVTVIELPLTAADSPALNIQVDMWQPDVPESDRDDYFESTYSRRAGNLLTSLLHIPVVDLDKQLQVSVLETGEVDANGQTAVTVQVLNGRGEPVAAEVALSIASQSLYSHFPDHNRPQYSSLFRSVAIGQDVYHSFYPRRDLSYDNFGGCGCGGGWWGEERLPGLVNDMPSFWFPGLQTDHNGQATILVTLPENADGWHFSAQAITADGQVGEGSK